MSEFRPTTTDMAPWLEQAWMERYLNRELTEDESDWFEAYLLDRPSLLPHLMSDRLLAEAGRKSFKGNWRKTALAATAAIAMICISAFLMTGSYRSSIEIPEEILVDFTRGDSRSALSPSTQGRKWVLITLLVPNDTVAVEVLAGDEERRLIIDQDGYVSFLLPRSRFEDGFEVIIRTSKNEIRKKFGRG